MEKSLQNQTIQHHKLDMEWDLIIEDIQQQKCAFVIGPDIIQYGDFKSFFSAVSNQLQGEQYISKFYKEEELFQIKFTNMSRMNADIREGKRKIARVIKDVIQGNKEDLEELISLLKPIPTHLIICLYPEEEVIHKVYNHEAFRYYIKGKASEKAEFVEPSINRPVVYNLLGKLSDVESLIVTYDDLFDYIFSILGDFRIPENLRDTLKKDINRVIFLGVNFNKWYMHILFKLLAVDKMTIAIDSQLQDTSRTFILDRLSLDMLSCSPKDFLLNMSAKWHEKKEINLTKNTIIFEDNKVNMSINGPVRIFISYSHTDEDFKKEIMLTLQPLINSKRISIWDDRQIIASQEWNKVIVTI